MLRGPRKWRRLRIRFVTLLRRPKGSLSESQLESLLKQLIANGKVQINGTAVSYPT
jgi:hypothetical protein